jgi:hypothetical protein
MPRSASMFSPANMRSRNEHPSIEVSGRWQFPPAAALITAAGRLMLAIVERMVAEAGGTYLLTDTDSMLIVASEKGGPVPCRTRNGGIRVNAITWGKVKNICAKLNTLNPYDRSSVSNLLKIEPCNYDRNGNQRQLYGLAVSAKRYVVYRRTASTVEIIKPSDHGLGVAYVPDLRKRYKPKHCKDQETDYPRWIVEAWEHLLELHFRGIKNPEDAILLNRLWFANSPAMMRQIAPLSHRPANVRKIGSRGRKGRKAQQHFSGKENPAADLIESFMAAFFASRSQIPRA